MVIWISLRPKHCIICILSRREIQRLTVSSSGQMGDQVIGHWLLSYHSTRSWLFFCIPCLFLGCSGLLGLYTEFGPWRAGSNLTLIRNPFTWVKHANIVFLEQPVGVGFSYSTEKISRTGNGLIFFTYVICLVINDWQCGSGILVDVPFLLLLSLLYINSLVFLCIIKGYNDFEASKDNLLAIKAFFRKFPERASNTFYLASESYGGHYIPQWTLQVLGDKETRKHFKGYLLGMLFIKTKLCVVVL